MINYRRYGRGRTVVLQHGFLGGGAYWSQVMADFGITFDVIAPDLPGFAGSSAEPLPDSIGGYSAALIALLDSLKVERFSMVGHSMGGMIAQQTAIDYPSRIERLVLYGTAPSGHLPTRFETFEETIARFKKSGPAAAADVVATWFVEKKEHPLFPSTLDAGRGFTIDAVVNAMTIVPKWDARDRLKDIKADTLIITGDRDFATTPEHALSMWKAISGSRLCIVPGCSHGIHLEKPDVFNKVVGTFLSSGT
jgi:2-hydroxy-6-oxonona-2,4-dienedioate hydrolase